MLLELGELFTGVYTVVYDGEHALKYTLGRATEVVGPGIHVKWPIIQKFEKRKTKQTTLDLEPQVIQLKDDLVYEVGAKVVYQIVDLYRAIIEVDDLVDGLKNRLTIAVQQIVKAQDRDSISDTAAMIAAVRAELETVEDQWGIVIHEFGFSDLSPSPATLEVTQLRLLSEEKLSLFKEFHDEHGLSEQAAVSLISGAVMAVRSLSDQEADDQPDDDLPPPPPPAPTTTEEEDDRNVEDAATP